MSTKTNFKRVALVAVAALGLGVLTSVAPASAADVSNETLALGVVAATTPDITVSGVKDTGTMTSFGLITSTGGTAEGTNAKSLTSGATGTAVVYATAILGMAVKSATASSIVVTGGTISKITGTGGVIAANSTYATGTTNAIGVLVKPGVAAGLTFTVAAYTGSGVTATTPTNGALAGIWTFTVAATSGAGVYATTYSNISQQAGVAKGTVAAGTNTYDTSSRLDNGKVGIIYVALADAYGSSITTGTLAASATAGTLKIADASSDTGAETYSASTGFSTLTPAAANYIYVNQPAANTAGTSTVTITLDGQVLATKTINWAGDIASLTIDTANSAGTFANGVTSVTGNTASIGNVVYVAKDAAGNVVNLSAHPSVTGQTGALVGASLIGGTAGTDGGEYQTSVLGYGYSTMSVPSSILNGAGAYQLKITNAAGVTVKSAVVNAKVSLGGTYTFTVKWDKTSYVSGDIATMSISATDAYGNAVAEGTYLTGLSLAVNSGGFQDLSSCSATSAFSTGGVKKCKYAVLNTAGSYAYSVGLTNGSVQSAVIGTVPVSAGSAVSNADVLKAIVSLIASINKQIAALQKALLKK